MAQRFRAVIAAGPAADRLEATLPGPPLDLGQGLRLLYGTPLDDDELVGDVDPFWALLMERVEKAALAASELGPVAYVEADFCGGYGWQSAVVWREGRPVLGPCQAWLSPNWAVVGPVNQALLYLGVVPAPGLDAWDTLRMRRVQDPEPDDDED